MPFNLDHHQLPHIERPHCSYVYLKSLYIHLLVLEVRPSHPSPLAWFFLSALALYKKTRSTTTITGITIAAITIYQTLMKIFPWVTLSSMHFIFFLGTTSFRTRGKRNIFGIFSGKWYANARFICCMFCSFFTNWQFEFFNYNWWREDDLYSFLSWIKTTLSINISATFCSFYYFAMREGFIYFFLV